MKRGLSSIVTTLILILLALVAVGIVWVVVKGLIDKESEAIDLDSFTINMKIKNVSHLDSGIDVELERKVGRGDFTGLSFAVSDGKTTPESSAWFTSKGELVETSGHSNSLSGKKLSSVHNRSVKAETYLYGTPGAAIFMPGGNRAENWILDANFRLDRGEFWIRQKSSEQGEEWRLGGNENNLNLQYRVAQPA